MAVFSSSTAFDEAGKAKTKFMAAVFGYLFIGLLITSAVALGVGFLFAKLYWTGEVVGGAHVISEQGTMVLFGLMIGSFVLLLIDQVAMSITAFKSGKGLWIWYVLYAVIMGVFFSTLLVAGIDFATMGEALGITAVCFLVMFLVGYFSPANLSAFGLIGLGLLIGVLLVSLFFGIWFLIAPGSFYIWNLVSSLIIVFAMMLFIGFDANNMKKIVERGGAISNNVAMYCAMNLYVDFITMFIRVLWLIMAFKDR